MINLIENNQKIIDSIEQNGFEVDEDLFQNVMKFKKNIVE
jgi:hypothetical protein